MDRNEEALKRMKALRKVVGDNVSIEQISERVFDARQQRFTIFTEEEQAELPEIHRETADGEVFFIHEA